MEFIIFFARRRAGFLDAIETDNMIGLRNRAIVGVMVYVWSAGQSEHIEQFGNGGDFVGLGVRLDSAQTQRWAVAHALTMWDAAF